MAGRAEGCAAATASGAADDAAPDRLYLPSVGAARGAARVPRGGVGAVAESSGQARGQARAFRPAALCGSEPIAGPRVKPEGMRRSGVPMIKPMRWCAVLCCVGGGALAQVTLTPAGVP